MNAYRALPRFDFRRPFRHWLLRITTNLCRNRLAAKRRKPISLTAEGEGGDWLDPEDPGAPPGDAPSLAEMALDADRVRAAIECLPDAYRVAVVLRYLNDLTLEEVSEITEVPVATVKTHLHRARAALKRILAPRAAPGETSAAGGGTT